MKFSRNSDFINEITLAAYVVTVPVAALFTFLLLSEKVLPTYLYIFSISSFLAIYLVYRILDGLLKFNSPERLNRGQ